ncbi:MAG: cyanophycinase [Flavobacteriales bacterium]|nr:cyanophycinase [Flavobacteriales bacterium]
MAYIKGKGGVLIPVGGAEDRGEEEHPKLPFDEKGVLRHILDEAKGKDSKVILVTTASKIPTELKVHYGYGFGRLGCSNLRHYHITSKEQCSDKELLEDFRTADVIMFSGGNQSRIPKAMRNTELHKMLLSRYEEDGLVIAGTSAGAMAMSSKMIAGGSAPEAFLKGAVKMRKGLSFIPEVIIDTHFVRRGRFGRLAEAMAKYPDCIGIGLAEDTGAIISGGGEELRVIGSGMLIVMDPGTLTHNNHELLEDNTLMSMTGLTTHFLVNGDRFNFKTRATSVLPLEEEFI